MLTALTDLFADMTARLKEDRDSLNGLDGQGDGDTGDNMVANFETITSALRQVQDQNVTVDQALNHASQVLREQGKGATAPIYANGLQAAAQDMQGKTSFGIDDIQDLLGGLLKGAQQTPGVEQGGGGLLDALLPGVTTFLEARRNGGSVLEALMQGFMASQRGTYQTTKANSGFGRFSDQQTQGRVDPGAAGASSVLGGLLGSLLSGGLRSGRGEQQPSSGLDQLFRGGLGQLFGGLGGFGGGGNVGGQQRQRGGDPNDPQAKLGATEVV